MSGGLVSSYIQGLRTGNCPERNQLVLIYVSVLETLLNAMWLPW
jgi:hypothetical protein